MVHWSENSLGSKLRGSILLWSCEDKSQGIFTIGCHLVTKSALSFPNDKPPMAIGYKYRYWRVVWFISAEVAVIIVLGVPYLSRYPENYSNVSICYIHRNNMIGRYFSVYDSLNNHNRMRDVTV